jgi:sortase A
MGLRRIRLRRRALAVICFILGTVMAAQAVRIKAKAALAQVLLERAWSKTREGAPQSRPWPWADTWPIARLEAPEWALSFIVLEGATGNALAFAPGRLSGSARPGTPGHVVVAGHRDTHFAFLENIAIGERLLLEASDGTRRSYRVTETMIRDRQETDLIQPTASPTLTLITCWPFNAVTPGGPLRFVVRAQATGDELALAP